MRITDKCLLSEKKLKDGWKIQHVMVHGSGDPKLREKILLINPLGYEEAWWEGSKYND